MQRGEHECLAARFRARAGRDDEDVDPGRRASGSDAKAEKNRAKSNVHGDLTEAGKSVKDTTLKGKP